MECGEPCCLDLANHLNSLKRTVSEDRYARLLDWAAAAGSLSPGELGRLRAEAERRPAEAERVGARALELARLLRRLLTTRAEGRPPDPGDLARLNRELAAPLGALGLRPAEAGYRLGWEEDAGDLEKILWPMVRSAAELLVSPDLDRLKLCAADSCGWLFLDRSRNGRRRWCDMKVCGNREKVRRHREAARDPGSRR